MADFIWRLFDSDFLPHGHCYRWEPALVWLNVVSDASIGLAYFWIPVALFAFVRKRTDLPFRWVFVLFAAFIVACGTTHLMEVWTLWHGTYRLSGVIKAGTALVSLVTAVALVPLFPEALALPSAVQLQAANDALRNEIAERQRADERLQLVDETLRAVGAAQDLASGLRIVLARICEATRWSLGEAWIPRADHLVLGETWCSSAELERFAAASHGTELARGRGLVGRAFESRRPVWSSDLAADATFCRPALAADAGLRTAIAIPVLAGTDVVGVLQFLSIEPQAEDQRLVALVSAVALDLGSVIQRRHAEEALRDNQATLATLFEFAPDAMIAVGHDGLIVRANAQAEHAFGYRRAELEGQPIEMLVPERLRAAHRDHRAGFLAEPRTRAMGAGLRLFGLRKDGSEFPVEITLTPVGSSTRAVVMAVIRDVSERREAQRRFRRLFESAPDALIIVSPEARMGLANSHTEVLFGYRRDELAMQTVDMLVPPRFREQHRKGIESFFANPRVLHLGGTGPEIFGLRKDGTEMPLEITLSPLDVGGTMFVITAIRDLSERRRGEHERDRLMHELRSGRERLQVLSTRLLEAQESERRAIARELHDEIGQELTAVSYDLQAVQRGAEPAVRARLIDEALTVTQRVLRQVRDISLDLRPTLLDDLGLTAAVRWYLERQAQRLKCRGRLTSDLADIRFSPQVETACFRVAQEALTNVARHAGARQVHVELRRIDDELHLAVHDDGAGFDVDVARGSAVKGKSMGLLGMEERALLVGGRFEVASSTGGGTTVHAWFPLPRADAA